MKALLQDPGSWLRLPSWPPGWDGLHPWMVHCPMALFLTVPVFIFLAMILFHRGRWMSFSALLLLGLGIIGTWLSVSTGLAARDYLNQTAESLSPEALQVLEKHQQLASTVLPLYGGLFGIYLILFLLSLAVRPFDHPVWLFFMNFIFLILLIVAGLVLVNTGEWGGRLVHEFGIHGRIRAIPPAPEKPLLPGPKPKTAEKPAAQITTEQKPPQKEKPQPQQKPQAKQKPTLPEKLPPEPPEKQIPPPEEKPISKETSPPKPKPEPPKQPPGARQQPISKHPRAEKENPPPAEKKPTPPQEKSTSPEEKSGSLQAPSSSAEQPAPPAGSKETSQEKPSLPSSPPAKESKETSSPPSASLEEQPSEKPPLKNPSG